MTDESKHSGEEPDVAYLSDEWIQLADAALVNVTPVTENVEVAVQILGEDNHPSAGYRLILGPDRVRMLNDGEPGHVRLTMPYQVSAAIARGEIGAQRAFLDGRIQIGGDTTALLGHQDQLAAVDDQLADLRSRTRF